MQGIVGLLAMMWLGVRVLGNRLFWVQVYIPVTGGNLGSHRVFPIWDLVWWYQVELVSVEHIVYSPMCWNLDLVIQWSHDSLYPKWAIPQGVQFW